MTDIKLARIERGLTQEQLAEMVGVSVMAISNYETGKRVPTAEVLSKIKAVLGMDDKKKRVEISTEELTRAAMPLVNLLRKKGDYYTTVIVTSTMCELMQPSIYVPLPYDD